LDSSKLPIAQGRGDWKSGAENRCRQKRARPWPIGNKRTQTLGAGSSKGKQFVRLDMNKTIVNTAPNGCHLPK
jgi:hypothetical protein